jgi:hypothetical protein
VASVLVMVTFVCHLQGNQGADKLAGRASAMPSPGPEAAVGTPRCAAGGAVSTWTVDQLYCDYCAWRG